MIKAVIFDVDGVLIDSFEANLKFFQDLMGKTGYKPPTREEFPAYFHLNMMDAVRAMTENAPEDEVKKIWEMGKGRAVKYDLGLLKVPDEVEEIIEGLSKNYLLGIATSRIKESVFEVPRLAKLKKYFQTVVAFQDTENHKPHPEPLLFAVQELGVKPEECVYIGDVENDVTAAHAAGMKAIIYSKESIEQADACTLSFDELPDIIKLWEN